MMFRQIIYIRLFLLILIPLMGFYEAGFCQQQKDYLTLSGVVEEGQEPLADAVIRIFKNGGLADNKKSDASGNFEVRMDLGQKYTIEFTKQGYVTKKIRVNSAVPQGQGGTWKVEFSIGLFQDYPDLNVSALEEPVTRIHYKTGERGFGYDERYTRKMMSRINDILRQRRQLVDRAYQKIIDQADRLFDQENYRKSIEIYQKALEKRSDERYPKNRIEKARELIREIRRKQALYDEAIQKGDQLKKEKNFEKAKKAYSQALEHQPSRNYPQQQISKIERILQEKKAQAQRLQARYETLVGEADQLFDEDQLVQARDKYKQALNVKPDQRHPRQRLDRIAGMIRKKEERRERYENLILQGDQSFAAGTYDQASHFYNQAADMEMGDPYPREQLSKIDSILQAQKQQQRRYNEFIEQGDRAFQDESWTKAREAYSGALNIRPKASYPDEQIQKIEEILSRRRMRNQKYEAAIQEGDRYFHSKKYTMARQAYQQALQIKPGQSYPDRQIDKIDEILAERKARESRYKSLIQSADEAFKQEKYEASREDYQQAINIKPERAYPRQQLELIRRRLVRLRQKKQARQAYEQKIDQADQAFSDESYHQAKDFYGEALQMHPHEEYPQDQIARIDQILSKRMKTQARKEATEEAYSQAIQRADERFNKEAYRGARELYEQALEMKSGQEHPQQRIDRIDQILSQRRERKDKYQAAVDKGDRLFNHKQYQQAVEAYQQALEIQSTESYPTSQIQKIRDLMANRRARKEQQDALEKRYKGLVSKADGQFKQEHYQVARKTYSQAAQIRPEESYPPRKIREIDSIFEQRKEAKEKAYRQAISQADALFDQDRYEPAIDQYRQALDVKPEAEYPPKQISRIKNLQGQLKRNQQQRDRLDSLYARNIDRADAYFGRHNYYNAKTYYEKALQYKPDEEYPQKKIQVCINKIQEFEEAQTRTRQMQKEETGAKAGSNQSADHRDGNGRVSALQHTYLSELARKYPEGVTKEHYDKDNRKITRVIVNYDGVADEYHRVRHSWGAVFYFRNGRPITEEVYRLETREHNP